MYMPGSNMVMDPTTTPFTKVTPYPIDSVWHVVAGAFDSLTIPLTTLDPVKHVVANEGFKVRQTIGKVRLSHYFECGTTQVGPNADSYELYITIFTQLEPVGLKGTKITTTIEAAAKPMQFAQDYSRCTSKGELESLITDIIISRVRK